MSHSPERVDPLADTVALLRPEPGAFKLAHGAGRWRVRRTEHGQPFYCAMLDGGCRLELRGRADVVLRTGDFVLVPAAREYAAASLVPPAARNGMVRPVELGPGEVRLGRGDGSADTRMLIGHCRFGAPDAALILTLLPEVVVVRGRARLEAVVRLLDDEARERRPGREMILRRLLEVLLIEALRGAENGNGEAAAPGLVRGLGERGVAAALRRMHGQPRRAWTVPLLAREANLSRTVFFERFRDAVGVAPMAYLLGWRMALAKRLLREGGHTMAAVAERVGYGSASTFSTAFARHEGMSPTRYAREARRPGGTDDARGPEMAGLAA